MIYKRMLSIQIISRYFAILIFCSVTSLVSINAYSHGLASTSARLNLRPHNLVELRLQFNLITLLNAEKTGYSLPRLSALSEEDFEKLYTEVTKLFDRDLQVMLNHTALRLNRRYPSAQQVQNLLKREFITKSITSTQANTPYTFDDRRFYQVAYFDFKLDSKDALENIQIQFPKQLGNIYITYSEPKTFELHAGEKWSYKHKPLHSHHTQMTALGH